MSLQREVIPNIGKLGRLKLSDLQRIASKTEITNKEFCWIWTGTKLDSKKGHQHGIIWYNKKYVFVHRIMYHNFIEDVPIYEPNGPIVLHKCSHENDGRCINPWHLSLGYPKENTYDALKAGTLTLYSSNEKNHMSKLTDSQIQEIRELKGIFSQNKIAVMYGVNQSQISRYWNSKTRNK